ncbi:hypothetical protein ACIRU3_26170 [Streptomyces sp. NPDC101151]|uniref:hypothetical protein n=1 Tax=Streptomyces sp. NPDC101151 TaxID=3366115 RepID=UPI00382876B0
MGDAGDAAAERVDFGAVSAGGLGAEGCVDVGFGLGGGYGLAVVLPGVGWGRLLDGVGCREWPVGVGVGARELPVAVGVGVGSGVLVDVDCAWPEGTGWGVPSSGATNAQTPMPPRTSTAAPPAIHGARRGRRR